MTAVTPTGGGGKQLKIGASFINCTVNIQINDLRQIPIMIPVIEDLHRLVSLVDKAVKIKKLALLENRANFRLTAILKDIEKEIDMKIFQLYRI